MVSASGAAASDPIVNAIVDFAFASYARGLDSARRNALAARVMDSLGCAVAAALDPEVARVARAIGATGEGGDCAILLNGRGGAEHAAFLNGMMLRYHDWNDTYVGRNGGHPSDIIPAALAAGERARRDGDEVLRALGAANHLMLDMCDGSNALARGWDHATYVGIAAVVAAGLLGGLDRPQLANAVAMMAASGNMLLARSHKVSTWRSLASPQAGRNALFLASLAGARVSGPDPVFAGDLGFLHVVSGDMALQLDPARDRTGDSHLKMYPAVFHAQAPIELALAMRGELAARLGGRDIAASVDEIVVSTHAFAIKWAGRAPALWRPQNRETADHSIPFMTALALTRGEIEHDHIEAATGDPSTLELTQKIRVEEDPAYSARWPGQAFARLTIKAGDLRLERELPAGAGHAANPLAPGDRARKLRHNAARVIGMERAEAWVARLERFSQLREIGPALTP